jgi:hypothetical protein
MASRWLTQRRACVPECDASHTPMATCERIRAPFLGRNASSGRALQTTLEAGRQARERPSPRAGNRVRTVRRTVRGTAEPPVRPTVEPPVRRTVRPTAAESPVRQTVRPTAESPVGRTVARTVGRTVEPATEPPVVDRKNIHRPLWTSSGAASVSCVRGTHTNQLMTPVDRPPHTRSRQLNRRSKRKYFFGHEPAGARAAVAPARAGPHRRRDWKSSLKAAEFKREADCLWRFSRAVLDDSKVDFGLLHS